MAYELIMFLHYDGVTTSDILPSLVRFEGTNGLFPEMGSLTVTLNAPVIDANGAPVTLNRGDAIWPRFVQTSPQGGACPMAGFITDIRQEGDLVIVNAESLVTPLLRSTFSGSYTSSTQVYSILTDIVTGYTPPVPHEIYQFFAVYRPGYGDYQRPINATINNVVFDRTRVGAIYQYFSEFPAIDSLPNVLSSSYADYYTQEVNGKLIPGLGVRWSGHGNFPTSPVKLTYDNYLLSQVQWKESTDSILNDITIRTSGPGSYQKTDATSIALYGQRATTLYRPMYTDIGSAQTHADTMVAALKDPKVRCHVEMEAAVLFVFEAMGLNWVFQIVDSVTNRTENVVLSKVKFRWPEMTAECEFDNSAISLSNSGIRMDNRVINLEAAVPNQNLNINSSPTFVTPSVTSINIGSTCQLSQYGTDILFTPDSLRLDGYVKASAWGAFGGHVDINSASSEICATLNLRRGANSSGWNYKLAFLPFMSDSIPLSDTKPEWWLQGGLASHELILKHYNGTTALPVMTFNVDKTITCVSSIQATNYISTGSGNMDNYAVGDDAFIGDCNLANTMGIKGVQDATMGAIVFGSGKDTNIYRGGADLLKTDDTFQAPRINAGVLTQTTVSANENAPDQFSMPGAISYFNNTGSFQRFKTFRLRTGLNGTVRFRWNVKSQGMYSNSYMTINGVMVGSIINTGETLWAYHDDTLAVSLRPGDVLEFWGVTTNGHNQEFRDFKISYYIEPSPDNSIVIDTLPSLIRSTAGYYGSVKASGTVSGASNQMFSAWQSSAATFNGSQTLVCNSTKYNNDNCYNASTGTFTPPYTGKYQLNIQIGYNGIAVGKYSYILVEEVTSGTDLAYVRKQSYTVGDDYMALNVILHLTAGVGIKTTIYNNDGSASLLYDASILLTYFQAQYLGE